MSTFGQPPEQIERTRVYFSPGDVMSHKLVDKGLQDGSSFELKVKKFDQQGKEKEHHTLTDGSGLLVTQKEVNLDVPPQISNEYETRHRYVGVLSYEDNGGTTQRPLWILLKPTEYHQL